MSAQATARTDLPFLEVRYRDEDGDQAIAYLARKYEGIAVYHDEADVLTGDYEVKWDRADLIEVVETASTISRAEVDAGAWRVPFGQGWRVMHADRRRVKMETPCGASFSLTRRELQRLAEVLPALGR